ncbi:MAG: hypothetical protein RJA22_451 [Verrucomicrobiota bacterium]
MKHRVPFLILVALFLAATAAPAPAAARSGALRVFVQTDHASFQADWTRLLRQRGATVAGANRFPTELELARTDVLVVAMPQAPGATAEERRHLDAYQQRGGGLILLHDAVCSAQPEWLLEAAGGTREPGDAHRQRGLAGLYFQDVAHPITAGLSNFDLDDELLFQIRLAPGARPLATSFRTAKEVVPQIWIHERGSARVFASGVGLHLTNYSLPHMRGLLLRAIAWTGQRPVDSLTRKEELASFRYPAGGPSAPADALRRIEPWPEFDLSLVAAEPEVVKPIALDWDARGRLWVALTPEYPFKVDRMPGRDSIVILDKLGRDGRVGRRTVFCDGLVLPTGFVFHRDGVIVAQAPKILFIRDTDGDGQADVREVLFDGFGTYDTHAVINNLRWGLDGWVYGCQGYSGSQSTNIVNAAGRSFGKIGNGIFRFRPDGSALEQVASYGGNSWGIDFNWDGELFFSKANGPHVSHVVLPERYLARGRLGNATSDKSIEDHQKVYPAFGDTRHEYVQVAPVGVFSGASGATLYQGGAWPLRYHGNFFVCEPTVHIIHEDILSRGEGVTFDATRRDEREFVAGRDLWFRPVHTRIGPDGAMYILDFYCQAISHNDIRGVPHGPGNAAVRPDRDHQNGRIYRLQHKDATPYPVPDLANASPATLARALEHPNAWVRLTAQRLLAERGDRSIEPMLTQTLRSNRVAHARLHALWTLQNLNALSVSNLALALADRHPSVLNNALRAVAEQPERPPTNILALIQKNFRDSAERTRLDALCALTRWTPDTPTIEAVAKLFPDLKDNWTRSTVLNVAQLAPTNFLRHAYGSDRSESYRELAVPLVERLLAARDEGSAEWALTRAARAAARADKLKIAVIDTFARRLGDFSPPFSTNIEAALKTLATSENRALRVSAFPLIQHYSTTAGANLGGDQLAATLVADLTNEKLKEEDRLALLASLLKVPALLPEILTRVDALLAKNPPPTVQKAVITELGQSTNTGAATVLVKYYPRFNTENRQLALGTLARRASSALALLDAVEAKAISPADLGVSGPDRLRTHANSAVARRATQVFDAVQGPRTAEKDRLIARFREAFDQPADLKHGKEQFEKQCAICHRFADKGRDFGPDLTGTGLHGPAVLLTHILDPNRVVEGNFVPYQARTRKDEEYYGLIKTENRDSVTLVNLEGEVELKRADLASLQRSRLSFMPEGLEALGAKTLRDIVGYLIAGTPKGLRPLDLSPAFTADTRKNLFGTEETPSLAFRQFGIVMVDNVPFHVVNPAGQPDGNNLVLLGGGSGVAQSLPRRVEFPVRAATTKLYILGGVAGGGFPQGTPELHHLPAARLTLHYADGQTEEVVLRNGEHIADATRPSEVPGSRPTGDLVTRGQVRWFSLVPKRNARIETISLESFGNHLAPAFVAITAQVD